MVVILEGRRMRGEGFEKGGGEEEEEEEEDFFESG